MIIPKVKVLFVEDDKEWQDILSEIVSMLGYNLEFASTYEEAISKLERSTYHVALLDKMLKRNDPENEDGLKVAAYINEQGEGTRIVVLTAYGNVDDARKAFRDLKVKDFVAKSKPILEITKALQESSDEALLDFGRPSRTSQNILVTRDDAIEQFLSVFPPKVRISNAQNLELFARRLLGRFRPLLADRFNPKIFKTDKSTILKVRFWSKFLGFPIAAWFGTYSEMKIILEQFQSDKSTRLFPEVDDKIDELFDFNIFPDFGGAIFVLKNAELKEFES